MTTDAIREAIVLLKEVSRMGLCDPECEGRCDRCPATAVEDVLAKLAAYEAAQAKAAASADGEPDAEAFSVALDTLRNRLGGTVRPYEVEEFAKVLDAFAARRVAEAMTAERAQPDASESAAKIWYERIDKQPTVHGKIEELSAVIAEARQAGESAMRETAVRTAGAWVNKSASAMRLAAGEMTAQEIRAAQAIAAVIAGEISRALPDNT